MFETGTKEQHGMLYVWFTGIKDHVKMSVRRAVKQVLTLSKHEELSREKCDL